MMRESWDDLQDLLAAAWELPEPERAAFLERACDDPELRREVESILASEEGAETFLGSLAESVGLRRDDLPAGDLSGRRVGNYRLLDPLGRGGMGVVYAAERADGAFEQRVAVKLLAMGLMGSEGRHRFYAERQILAGLEHPAIARLVDGGVTEDATPYFVMELVEGERIDEWCDRRRLGIRRRLELLCKVCEAVDYAHRSLVVHRDLKPANVLVNQDGDPKLLDFGVAKLLSDIESATDGRSVAPLTPTWAAPEQMESGLITTATDTWGLGALAYFLLLGVRPRDRPHESGLDALAPSRRFASLDSNQQSEIARARSIGAGDLRKSLVGDLDAILQRALATEPARRYGSAGALAADLRAHLAARPVTARPPRLVYRLGRFVRRNRVAVAAGGVAALLLATLVVVSVRSAVSNARLAQRVTAERDRAEEVTAFMVDLFEVSEPDRARGRDLSARELLERGDERIRSRLQGQPETLAAMQAALGRVYARLGEPERAAGHLSEAIDLYRDTSGEGTPAVPDLLRELGEARAEQARWAEAESLLRQAAARYETLYGPADDRVAATLAILGRVLNATGSAYDEAERVLREALSLQEAAYTDDDLLLASTRVQLGVASGHQGETGAMEELLEAAVAAYRTQPDRADTDYAEALATLASVALARRDYDRAGELSKEALALTENLYGAEHYETGEALVVVAAVAAERGDLTGAEANVRRAVSVLLAPPEPRYGQAGAAMRMLTRVLMRQERFAEAELEARRAVAVAREYEDALRLAKSLWLHGNALREQGRFAEAEAAYDEVLRNLATELPRGHSLLPLTEFDAGVLASQQANWPLAEEHLRRALKLYEPLASVGSPRLASMRVELARVLIELGERGEADELLGLAVPVLREAWGADDPRLRDAVRLRER